MYLYFRNKERKHSEDDRKEPTEKDSRYEKEREKQAMEIKKRLREARRASWKMSLGLTLTPAF